MEGGEEELDEAHCGRREDEEGLEEAKGGKGDANPLGGEREKFDKDLDGVPDGGDADKDDPDIQEGDSKKDEDDKKLDEAQIRRIVREAFSKAFKK